MNSRPEIKVPAPSFELYELVMLHWDGEAHQTKITSRHYDLDKEEWTYGVAGSSNRFYANALEPRQ